MRCSFCILTVLGDLLDDGEVRFLGSVQTLEEAKRHIEALAVSTPGQFVIYNDDTGERVSLTVGVEG